MNCRRIACYIMPTDLSSLTQFRFSSGTIPRCTPTLALRRLDRRRRAGNLAHHHARVSSDVTLQHGEAIKNIVELHFVSRIRRDQSAASQLRYNNRFTRPVAHCRMFCCLLPNITRICLFMTSNAGTLCSFGDRPTSHYYCNQFSLLASFSI